MTARTQTARICEHALVPYVEYLESVIRLLNAVSGDIVGRNTNIGPGPDRASGSMAMTATVKDLGLVVLELAMPAGQKYC